MPDTPETKPTAQAMKAAAAIVTQNYGWCEQGGTVHLGYAEIIDKELDLPALLACAEERDKLKIRVKAQQGAIDKLSAEMWHLPWTLGY